MRRELLVGTLVLLGVWAVGSAAAVEVDDRRVQDRVEFQGEIPAGARERGHLTQVGSAGGVIEAPRDAERARLQAHWDAPGSTVEAVRLGACSVTCQHEGNVTDVSNRTQRMLLDLPVENGSVEWLAYLHEGAGVQVTVTGEAVFYTDEPTEDAALEQGSAAPTTPGSSRGGSERGLVAAASVAAAGLIYLLRDRLRWLWLVLSHRIGRRDVLENDTRRRIRRVIQAQPGIHFRALASRLDLAHDPLNHHLRLLRDRDLVVEEHRGGRRCLFWAGQVSPDCRAALAAATCQGACTLLAILRDSPGMGTSDLAKAAGLAPSTTSYHLQRLADAGAVERTREGRYVRARLTDVGRRALEAFDPDET